MPFGSPRVMVPLPEADQENLDVWECDFTDKKQDYKNKIDYISN